MSEMRNQDESRQSRGKEAGIDVASGTAMMTSNKQTADQHPGSIPDIRADAGSITFVLAPRVPHHARLMIRCAPDGELWVSIAPALPSRQEPSSR